MSLGELARANPSATQVFLRHRLDFCCGGRRSLAEACDKVGLDPAQILDELEQEAARGERAVSWEDRSQAELADYIVDTYHAAIRRDLPPLIEAARRVERVHAGKPAVPAGLAAVLEAFLGEMERHMAKEEQILFPILRLGAHGDAVNMPVRVMEHEHDLHADRLAQIRALTGDLVTPPHACATWRALYAGLAMMQADLMQHVHLENNILFARAVER
jgi:regulator of cell morphogenesis and NO signaling